MTVFQSDTRAQLSKQFAVSWDSPADAAYSWLLEPRHAATAALPLELAVAVRGYNTGFRRAAGALGLPLYATTRQINGFLYRSFRATSPARSVPEDQLLLACESLGEAGAMLRRRWETQLRPEAEKHLAFWAGFDLQKASLVALTAHFDHTLHLLDRIWEMYFLVSLPVSLARSQFAAQHAALFGPAHASEAMLLLQALDGPDVALERALLQLCRMAARTPIARDALRWCADHEVVEALSVSEAGRSVLESLNAFLENYGYHREDGNLVAGPTWREDPAPVIRRMRAALLEPQLLLGDATLQAEHCDREESVGARLEQLPREQAQRYSSVLRGAQHAVMIQAEAESWLLQRCMAAAGAVVAELGRRFAAAGVIAAPADVAYLDLGEIRQIAETLPAADQRLRIARRRAEFEHNSGLCPVEVLGNAEGKDAGPLGALLSLLAA